MYDEVVVSIRIIWGETNAFSVTIDLHRGYASSLSVFALIIDDFTKHIQDEVSWCMLFADYINLINELELELAIIRVMKRSTRI